MTLLLLRVRQTVRASSVIAIMASVAVVSACKPRPSTHSASGAGHRVTARVEGTRTSLNSDERQVIVAGQHGKVIIEANRAMIEGLGWTPIPEKVDVNVEITEHSITVEAGEVSINRGRK